ncbi:MAG TPA: YkgJ family cysteine cluster protein [Methanocorpusculum sp.]|nr:YkgJ family cysteine cluster protein [Methanocorpusculum sp.]
MDKEVLIDSLRKACFRCEECGLCCSGCDNEVIVSPDEVDALSKASGFSFEEIAEPYPEWFEENGERFTLAWVLRRGSDGNCMFLENNRCRVYASRPHLCRTYPFMLNGDELIISECPALGKHDTADAGNLADALIKRQEADDAEVLATKREYQKHSIISGETVVIDSRGTHIWKI